MLGDEYSTGESVGNGYFLNFNRFRVGVLTDPSYENLIGAIVKADAKNFSWLTKYGAPLGSAYSTDMCLNTLCYRVNTYDPLLIYGYIDHYRGRVSGTQFDTDVSNLVQYDQNLIAAIAQYQQTTNKSYADMNNGQDIQGILNVLYPPPAPPATPATPSGGTSIIPSGSTTLPVVGTVQNSTLLIGGGALLLLILLLRR